MAGASMGDDENPVAINVTPLVDIIFCLCVFFMISFKFKQIEGKFDTWLPKSHGLKALAPDETLPKEVRVVLLWDDANEKTVRQLGNRKVESDDELQELLRQAAKDFDRVGLTEIPVTIDADARTAWQEIVTVVNLCKREHLDKIQFALGAPPK